MTLKFPSVLVDFFGDCDLAWKRYIRPAGALILLMIMLRFSNIAWLSGADFIVQSVIVFLLGCFFADLKKTPWSPTVEMLLVSGLCFFALYLGNLALGFSQDGAGVLQYAFPLQVATLTMVLPMPFGFALRRLSQLIYRALIQGSEQRDPEDGPEIKPV